MHADRLLFGTLWLTFAEFTSAAGTTDDVQLAKADRCAALVQRNTNASTLPQRLEGLVGIGWDNLLNVETQPVLAVRYERCQTSPDGKFLLPDNANAVAVQKTSMDRKATYYDSYNAYIEKSTTTINVHASGGYGAFKASGSYEQKRIRIKQTMQGQKTTFLRTQLAHHAYTLMADFSGGLHPTFIRRLREITDSVVDGFLERARYLAELIIRDYGTHVLTNVKAGALIEKEDFVDSAVTSANTTVIEQFKAAAAVSFVGHFSASASASIGKEVTQDTIQRLSTSTKHSQINTIGGPSVDAILASDDDANKKPMTIDTVVPLDQDGVMLYMLVSVANLPDFEPYLLDQLYALLYNATVQYYEANAIPGCTDPDSENFDFQCANGDGFAPSTRCDEFQQVNRFTGGFTCPAQYEAVPIAATVEPLPDRTEWPTRTKCKKTLGFKRCKTVSYQQVFKDCVKLESFWCRAKLGVDIPAETGMLFGGLYDKNYPNPFTGSPDCPGHYLPYRLGSATTVCLSNDYQLDYRYSRKFGGFFSCQTPEASRRCPDGYSQHLATTLSGCDVYFCTRPEAFREVIPPTVKRPPFTSPSVMLSNVTRSTVFGYVNEKMWLKTPLSDALKEVSSKPGSKHIRLESAENVTNALSEWIDDQTTDILQFMQRTDWKTELDKQQALSSDYDIESFDLSESPKGTSSASAIMRLPGLLAAVVLLLRA
ncbi:macrophage expressed protein [Aphelenchoides avenae]|nr:macrophage expressed protein [Aphelenchus avenae]